MKGQTKAKIFLADERSCNETDWFRSYSTFNYGKYFNKHKHPFAGVYVLNDDTIAGSHSFSMDVKENSTVLLLPLVGQVSFAVNRDKEAITGVGQLHILQLHKGDRLTLLNYYENELINFIQVWIRADITGFHDAGQLFGFKLDESENELIEIDGSIDGKAKYPVISIGKFTGRREAVYKLQNIKNSLFVFIIQGVFEVQGMLLHARTDLAYQVNQKT